MKYHGYEICVGALLCFGIMCLTTTALAAQGVDHSLYAGLLKKVCERWRCELSRI